MFHNSNLVTPENFVQFRPSIRKLFIIFFNTDTQKDGWTHKLCTKRITPLPYTGMGRIFFPHFFYLSQNGVRSLCLLTLFCSDNLKLLNPQMGLESLSSLYSLVAKASVDFQSFHPSRRATPGSVLANLNKSKQFFSRISVIVKMVAVQSTKWRIDRKKNDN